MRDSNPNTKFRTLKTGSVRSVHELDRLYNSHHGEVADPFPLSLEAKQYLAKEKRHSRAVRGWVTRRKNEAEREERRRKWRLASRRRRAKLKRQLKLKGKGKKVSKVLKPRKKRKIVASRKKRRVRKSASPRRI